MKKFSVFMLLGVLLFSACTKEIDTPMPEIQGGVTIKEAKVARLYAVRKADDGISQSAVAVKSKLWPQESTIRIKFLNGEQVVIDKVKFYAKEWEELINLKFDWVGASEEADVKIGFDQGDEENLSFISWVTVGTDNKYLIPQDEPSINFVGFWDEDEQAWIEDEEFIKAEVLRAFGCVLGLDFEHKSPVTAWELIPPTTTTNKNKLRGYFGLFLPIEVIKERYLDLYTAEQTNYTAFDPTSIMVLPLSSTIMKDPKLAVQSNTELSETDKKFIKALYPKKIKIEWVANVWANSPVCMDKYDNLYFLSIRHIVTDTIWPPRLHTTLMKMDTQTHSITSVFDVPNEFEQIREIAVDGQGNVYFINNIDLFWGADLLMFDKNGNLLRNLSRWTGAMHFSPYARVYSSIRVLDNDDLYYVAEVSETNCGAIYEIQHYKYNPITQTSELRLSFSRDNYLWMKGNSVSQNNTLYLGLSYSSTQTQGPKFMKLNALTNDYSMFDINYKVDDIANNLASEWGAGVVGCSRDIKDLTLIRTGQRERWPGCYETVQFIYDYDPIANDASNLGLLPPSITMPDNSLLSIDHYQGLSAETRNGKALYIIGYTSGRPLQNSGNILRITNHR